MNKNAIQKYAIWARNELRNQITQRAFQYGITPKERPEKGLVSVNGIMLTPIEQKQRDQLVEEVWRKGFDQVIEELAYTWFNRLIAIRFMEVNDYLPEGVRVLSNSKNEFKPEILTSALNLDEAHFKKDLILKLIDEGKQEELYRYLLLAECNALNEILPVMFERMDGYTELMLPPNLLKSDSVIGRLVSDIDEADWKVTGPEDEEGGQVQIIGWLYQYYNSELKDETFADLKKKNKKISKERIPAATQLFTPDWIVRYMVENSLGRLWLEGHPNEELKRNWKYYLDEAEQEPEVEAQLKEIRKEYAALRPEDLSTADLAMGSGHILVYAFDVLMQIYRSEGYRDRDAVRSILENNLYGLDIDDRAAQLAYFAIMMKAREYDRRIFDRGIQPNVFAIQESNGISEDAIEYFSDGDNQLKVEVKKLISEMKNAKEYGSIITTSKLKYDRIESRLEGLKNDYDPYAKEAIDRIQPLIGPAKILSSSVWISCMNPPYLAATNASGNQKEYLAAHYLGFDKDLYSAFMRRALEFTKRNGQLGLITPYIWLFASSFEELRAFINREVAISSLIQLEYNAFEAACVPVTTFTLTNSNVDIRGSYVRLSEFKGIDNQKPKYLEALSSTSCNFKYLSSKRAFMNVPGEPICYWLSPLSVGLYKTNKQLSEYTDLKQGLITGDNDRFLRFWYECENKKIYPGEGDKFKYKWFPYYKGGNFRKWYGNQYLVVNWENDGYEIRNFKDDKGKLRSRPQNLQYFFREGFSWTALTIADFNVRYMPKGGIFDAKGSSGFSLDPENLYYIIGLLNSKAAMEFLSFLAPTMDYSVGSVAKIPIIVDKEKQRLIESLVKENIYQEKIDWDVQETSINFSKNPLVSTGPYISGSYDIFADECKIRFKLLLANEKQLNTLFRDIYQLTYDCSPDPAWISIDIPTKKSAVKALISYAVGTLFGRFSLDIDGVVSSSPEICFDSYKSIIPDQDNIIPIGEDEYFDDDLTARFVDWVKTIYGEETLEENLQFIADALDGKGSSREIIRKYFLNDFFADHCKTYKKRPIYWLFDSGKKNGFKCLIYMHRYQPDTIARIRTDYVHEQQERYRSQIKHINDTIDDAPKSEQVKMRKQLRDLQGKLDEVTKYEEKIHHLADQMIKIDLDDGVKHNYALFQDVLAKIK